MCSTAVLALAVVGCGSSTPKSAPAPSTASSAPPASGGSSTTYPAGKEQVCQARDQLKTSVAALTKPSLLVGGTTAIKAAIDQIQTDLTALKAAAKQDYGPQVDAVQTDLQQLQTTVGNLGAGDLAKNLPAVGSAISKVGTSSQALFSTLQAACGS
jgi:hypothetical protein